MGSEKKKIESFLPNSFADPGDVYTHPPGIGGTYHTFKLQQPQADPLSEHEIKEAWKTAKESLDEMKKYMVGFQANLNLNYSENPVLTHFLDTLLNNIGDPFSNGSYNLQTKFLERPVLDYFAALWHAKWPSTRVEEDSYWGFALSMGATEGNFYGLWNGRDYLSGRVLLIESSEEARSRMARGSEKRARPIYVQADYEESEIRRSGTHISNEKVLCFFSKAAHYSLTKAMVMLQVSTFYDEGMANFKGQCPLETPVGDEQWKRDGWPLEVPDNEDGSINLEALEKLVTFFAKQSVAETPRKYSFLFCFNYGTVFKGSYDDIEEAGKKLIPIFQEYNIFERKLNYTNRNGVKETITRTGWYFHVDGALGAAYMPFIEMARKNNITIPEDDISRSYKFDFSLTIPVQKLDPTDPEKETPYPLTHSIGMSAHKWIGCPVPSGMFMTKVKYQLEPPQKGTINYIGAADTTFAGSRSGFAAALLWDHFSQHSFSDLVQKAVHTQEIAVDFVKRLKELEEEIGKDLYINHPKLSLSIVFLRPIPSIVLKYSLSKEEEVVVVEGVPTTRYLVHAYAMEHVEGSTLDELFTDLSKDGSFDYDWSPSTEPEPLTPPKELIGW